MSVPPTPRCLPGGAHGCRSRAALHRHPPHIRASVYLPTHVFPVSFSTQIKHNTHSIRYFIVYLTIYHGQPSMGGSYGSVFFFFFFFFNLYGRFIHVVGNLRRRQVCTLTDHLKFHFKLTIFIRSIGKGFGIQRKS